MENIYTPKQERVLHVASLVVLAAFILLGMREYISAFLGAGILYVVFQPWWIALVVKRGWGRATAASLLIAFSIVVIILPFLTLSLMLAGKISYYSEHTDEILDIARKAESLTGYKLTNQDSLRKMLQSAGSHAGQLVPSLAGNALDVLVVMGLLFFTLYYMFVQQEAFQRGLKKYLPFNPDTQKKLAESLKNNVNANVIGQVLVCVVQGALTSVTLWIFGVPDAPFWGVVAFFMAFIPVLGTPLVWVPAGIIKISQGHTGQGIGILLVGAIVIINIDNLLRMMLAKRMGDIHPLITLAGIVLGVPLFGILGLVMGPLLLSYFIVLMGVLERDNRQQRHSETPPSVS